MKLQEVEINKAQGLHLSDELNLGSKILPKNHILTNDDIRKIKSLGMTSVFGAWSESGDIDFNTALGIVAAKVSGKNLGFRIDTRGFAEIVATAKGIFNCYHERLSKFNKFSEYFVLNTIMPFGLVKNGDVIARLEILTPIISQEDVDNLVFSLSGNVPLLSVDIPQQQVATILMTYVLEQDDNVIATESLVKLKDNHQYLNLDFIEEQRVKHKIEDISAQLDNFLKTSAEIIFIVSGQRNYTANDVIYSAITSIADEIVCKRIPVFGASDLIIATKRNKKIIALPYNYAFVDAETLDSFIKIAILKEKLLSDDFNHPQNAFIAATHIKDTSELIQDNSSNKNASSIAAVILAAGQSKRIGKNKLLAEIDGKPLILKAVQAAVNSKASPVFVVTGYQADNIENVLEDVDINIVYNPNFRIGVKTSINIGLKSVPSFCDGAIIIPADMPNITPDFINKMIAKFKKKQDKHLVLADKKGQKTNPVIWSKSLYNIADLAAENADLRPIFLEHADYTTSVKATNDELLDVNFQHDLEVAQKLVKG